MNASSFIEASSPLIAALRNPACYPHPVVHIDVLETHISWVLLTGQFAYKVKKPVNLGFLDFTTLEARRHYCTEELRLNRRLAPSLYHAVVKISGSVDTPSSSFAEPVFSASSPVAAAPGIAATSASTVAPMRMNGESASAAGVPAS